jgi:hypothetical protein
MKLLNPFTLDNNTMNEHYNNDNCFQSGQSSQSIQKRNKTTDFDQISVAQFFSDPVEILNSTSPEFLNGPEISSECDHNWMYATQSSERQCEKCLIIECCPHENWSFDLGHRKCSDCGIVPFGMKIEHPPPLRVVYNRNIKSGKDQSTAPLIIVGMNSEDKMDWAPLIRDYTIEVIVVEENTFEPLTGDILKGTTKYTFSHDRMKQDGGQEILFKGLKMASTSQQKKQLKNGKEIKDNNFMLQWSFYANKHDSSSILLSTVRSQPFAVHSHSKQIDEINVQQCPPTITLAIPNNLDTNLGFRNMKVAIFGKNIFDKSQIRIGPSVCDIQKHNDGAGHIILTEDVMTNIRNSNNGRQIKIPLEICNDKKNWIKTDTILTFTNDAMLAEQLLQSVGSNMSEFSFKMI